MPKLKAHQTSGYYVTSNWHGDNVSLGCDAILTATTTDASVDRVMFIWKDPTGSVAWTDIMRVQRDCYFEGKQFYNVQSTYEPEELGDWGVEAFS